MPSGSVSLANTRLSLVSTAPFVDFSAAGTLTPYLRWRIILTDSAGKTATSRIVSAGTGETLGDVLNATNAANSPTRPYGTFDGVSATGFHAVSGEATIKEGGLPGISYTSGGLYKAVFTYNKTSGGNVYTSPRLSDYQTSIGTTVTRSSSGTYTQYTVVTSTTGTGVWCFSTAAAVEFAVSDFSLKQVLTPSATGVVTSAWTVESGFNYNDSGGYTYRLIPARRSFSFGFDMEF